MASGIASSGPTPAALQGGGVALPPTTEQLQRSFDFGIWYLISLWPALHVACQNEWGGPETKDKKDWFAGAISQVFEDGPGMKQEELEDVLVQVMFDEFDCNLEDDSEVEVAGDVLALRKRLFEEQDLNALRELELRWRNRGQMKMNVQVIDNENDGEDGDDWEGFNDDEVDEDGDIGMDSAQDIVPNLVPTLKKEKPEPDVDEDGFTKVISKKKR